ARQGMELSASAAHERGADKPRLGKPAPDSVQLDKMIRQPEVVRIEERNPTVASSLNSRVAGDGGTGIGLRQHPDARIPEGRNQFGAPIRGTVVDHNQLEVPPRLAEHAGYRAFDRSTLVPKRHDDTEHTSPNAPPGGRKRDPRTGVRLRGAKCGRTGSTRIPGGRRRLW